MKPARGFTLIELLTTLGIVALLVSLVAPGLRRAREQAKLMVCHSHLRQLVLANGLYADDSGGSFAPGMAERLSNLHRWHGVRTTWNEPFQSEHGPLVNYLGLDRAIRACPVFAPAKVGFEAGCGGYGYNNAYIGSQTVTDSKGQTHLVSDRSGARRHQLKRPGETVMFTDAGFVDGVLIEYSFAEPRYHVEHGTRADPSIHFRHMRRAGVAWCDGHVTSERRTLTWFSGLYEGDPERHDIGWFGESDDNSLFDLQ